MLFYVVGREIYSRAGLLDVLRQKNGTTIRRMDNGSQVSPMLLVGSIFLVRLMDAQKCPRNGRGEVRKALPPPPQPRKKRVMLMHNLQGRVYSVTRTRKGTHIEFEY